MKKVLFTIMALLSISLFVVGCSSKEKEPEIEPTLTVSPTDTTVAVGESFKLTSTLKPVDKDAKITFSSEDESIATVSETGMVSAVKEGKTRIIAKYGKLKGVCNVTVTKKNAPRLTVSPKDTTVKAGESFQLEAKLTPADENAKITFSSEDESIATVNETGTVSAVKEGKTKIIAKYGDLEGVCNLTVAEKEIAPTLTVSPKDTTIEVGESFQLKAVLTPADENAKITFSSEDESTATVSETGMVSAVKEGETRIIAKYGDLKETCNITIRKMLPKMKLEITELYSTYASFKVIPPAEDMRWVCIFVKKKDYDQIYSKIKNIPEFYRNVWQDISRASIGSKQYQDFVKSRSIQGTQTKYSYEDPIADTKYILTDNSEYVLMIYGIDQNAYEKTEVLIETFKTKPRVEDPDFKINVEINNPSADVKKFKATITPSDPKKEYFVFIATRDRVEDFKRSNAMDELTNDLMNQHLYEDNDPEGKNDVRTRFLRHGTIELGEEYFDMFNSLKAGKRYTLLVWGWDKKGGRSTDIICTNFTTPSEKK